MRRCVRCEALEDGRAVWNVVCQKGDKSSAVTIYVLCATCINWLAKECNDEPLDLGQ